MKTEVRAFASWVLYEGPPIGNLGSPCTETNSTDRLMPNPFVFGLRLTAFGENAEWLNLAPVMSWAFDRTPDLEQKNQMMQQALVRAQGSSHGWHHTIQSTPGRLDLLQEAALNPFSVGRVSATMHSSTVVIAKFMEGVISHCDRLLGAHVTRLAMGATLRWQVKSPQEGAKLLHLWHAHLDVAEGDTEIIFQRNRPTSIPVAVLHQETQCNSLRSKC